MTSDTTVRPSPPTHDRLAADPTARTADLDRHAATLGGSDLDTTPSAPATPRAAWWGLVVLALPALVTSVDLSVLFLALPKIVSDIGGTAEQQLWIMDVYGFVVASLLIPMGALGDRIGRRKLLLAGSAGFAAFSLLAAFSPNATTLLIARAGLGIAGATLAPSSLALLKELFHNEGDRAKATGIWTMCFMGGSILGPLVGGLLLSGFWWGAVFLMAVPVMALVLVAGPKLFPESQPGDRSLDPTSVLLAIVALFALMWAITSLGRSGLSTPAIIALAVAVIVGIAFTSRQRKVEHPLLDLGLFNGRIFPTITLLSLAGGAFQGGGLLTISLYMQVVLGFSPLRTGLLLIPTGIAMFIGIGLGGALGSKIRPAVVIAAGLVVSAIGYLLIALTPQGAALQPMLGYGLAMVGLGPGMSLSFGIMLSTVPHEKTASASSITEAAGQFGVAAGIAVLGSVAAGVYSRSVAIPSGVSATDAARIRSSVSEGLATAATSPHGQDLANAVRTAYTQGLHWVAIVAVIGFILMGVAALAGIGSFPAMRNHQSSSSDNNEGADLILEGQNQ